MHTIESGWGHVFLTFLGVLVFMRYWGWVDGTDRKAKREREAQLKAEAEGWAKWASTKGN